MENIRTLVQIAGNVQEGLTSLRHSRYFELMKRLTSLTGKLEELNAESRKMSVSLMHNWFTAADRCCSRITRLLSDISHSISQVKQLAEAPQKKAPTLAQILEELDQVQDEFGSVDLEKSENTIFVVTDPITLEDVPLGPFRIQLELGKLGDLYKDRPYRVIALDPNPAATDSNVTHPHVTSQRLCEGDGAAALTASLEQGRLSDFLTMVRSILNTYNPDSPYIALHDWTGQPCHDCGYTMSSEDTYFCQHCEHDYCSECSTYCRLCEEPTCLGCSGQCPHCEDMVCRNCISECERCGELFCESCLEENLCPNCRKETEKENEEQQTQITTVSQEANTSQPQTKPTEIKPAG